jgi:Leucine-rich repeat (LRR) protein
LFNQTEKEISSIDLNSCTNFRLKDEQIDKLKNIKYIFCDKDKLARYNPENEILKNADLDKDVFMLEETGHFPYYEDPEKLEKVFLDIFKN